MYNPKIIQSITVSQPGTGETSGYGYFDCPVGEEQWFHIILSTKDNLTVGTVTFGEAVCLSDGSNYYPMENNGYKTVARADIPKLTNPPMSGVVSFFGQSSSGRLGVTNTTDGSINVRLVCAPRTLREVK